MIRPPSLLMKVIHHNKMIKYFLSIFCHIFNQRWLNFWKFGNPVKHFKSIFLHNWTLKPSKVKNGLGKNYIHFSFILGRIQVGAGSGAGSESGAGSTFLKNINIYRTRGKHYCKGAEWLGSSFGTDTYPVIFI